MSDRINRRNVLTLELQGDSWKDILSTMRHILFVLESEPENEKRNIASGGPNSGYVLESVVNEGMTHERYIEEINQWLDERRVRK